MASANRDDCTMNSVRDLRTDGHSRVHVGNHIEVHNYNEPNRDRCLADLRLTDPRDDKTRIERQKGGLLKDSSSWILDHADFRRWRDDEQSRLLWIKGDPGKGKTMLLCGIIDELKKEPDNRLSYFFCQATDVRLNNATSVLCDLLYLLLAQEPLLRSHWDALAKILINTLQDSSRQNTFLIIDALNECETHRDQLLDLLVHISSSSQAKLIVSSRGLPRIEERLNAATQKLYLCLELNHESISAAVSKYITYKVEELARSKNYDSETRDALQQHLASNANDTFLWVALVCQELSVSETWDALDVVKEVPAGLEALYGRMM
ncbi:heterokaryon incompatibility protein [Ilyonectria destructans]|nr:heterokaryon incompatibility protein [Ilyonectria destructans]